MLRFVGISQVNLHNGLEERWIFEADLTVTEEERRVGVPDGVVEHLDEIDRALDDVYAKREEWR